MKFFLCFYPCFSFYTIFLRSRHHTSALQGYCSLRDSPPIWKRAHSSGNPVLPKAIIPQLRVTYNLGPVRDGLRILSSPWQSQVRELRPPTVWSMVRVPEPRSATGRSPELCSVSQAAALSGCSCCPC